MLASKETQAARRKIDASMPDPHALASMPLPIFVAKLVSQLALAPTGSDCAPVSDRAPRGATVFDAQARPARRDVKDFVGLIRKIGSLPERLPHCSSCGFRRGRGFFFDPVFCAVCH